MTNCVRRQKMFILAVFTAVFTVAFIADEHAFHPPSGIEPSAGGGRYCLVSGILVSLRFSHRSGKTKFHFRHHRQARPSVSTAEFSLRSPSSVRVRPPPLRRSLCRWRLQILRCPCSFLSLSDCSHSRRRHAAVATISSRRPRYRRGGRPLRGPTAAAAAISRTSVGGLPKR